MKIFVTGFQRSGTSLLRDLVEKHPDIKKMWHEKALLKMSKKELFKSEYLPDVIFLELKNNKGKGIRSRRYKVDFDLKTSSWGEKIPYSNIVIKKGFKKSIIEYCRKWNEYFLSEARIIHIVRHPIDVGISTKRRGFSKNIRRPINVYKNSVPKVLRELEQFDNVLNIKYEDLLLKSERTLRKIYKFCNLEHSDETIKNVIDDNIFRFGSINKSRAFVYKNMNIEIESLDLKNIIKVVNLKVEGIKYSL